MNDVNITISFEDLKSIVGRVPEIVGSVNVPLNKDQYKELLYLNKLVFDYIPDHIKTESFCLLYLSCIDGLPISSLKKIIKIHKTKEICEACVKVNPRIINSLPKKLITSNNSALAAFLIFKDRLEYNYYLQQLKRFPFYTSEDFQIELLKLEIRFFKWIENPSPKVIDYHRIATL